jgi:hypothetical protein
MPRRAGGLGLYSRTIMLHARRNSSIFHFIVPLGTHSKHGYVVTHSSVSIYLCLAAPGLIN